jgi:hypothetical protein
LIIDNQVVVYKYKDEQIITLNEELTDQKRKTNLQKFYKLVSIGVGTLITVYLGIKSLIN